MHLLNELFVKGEAEVTKQRLGLVAEIQHYCIQDGPGIRTTVFMKGCPLRCLWCHNPEMLNPKQEVWYNQRICAQCGRCVEECPEGAITEYNNKRVIDRKACLAATGCRKCADICPTSAMNIVGKYMTVEDAVAEVMEDVAFYRRSGGGTCISGGEPLMQADFTVQFLKRCQERLIDTAMETCGHVRWDLLSEAAQYADLVLIDIKHMDPVSHKQGTGVSNETILENIARLAELGKKIRIRLPVIPGFNDSEINLRKTAEFMVLNNLEYIDLLPFHSTGSYKYEQLDREYECLATREPSSDEMVEHMNLFKGYGLNGTIGGADVEPL